ncbi:MAG: hypothetical protein EZS28_009159 [Streblomastix strix]|uniref:Tyr recombinase domain-containing protein n=1 Tax=Streblomastix strix TaxID=222440 RepID=A0A5J4WM16_9EUKA|nr:MAG: hypothetical protein EZS28_009159 [Streblomastix strix]
MSLFVTFSAAQMTELSRMLIGGINIDEVKTIIKIKVKKSKKEIEYIVEVSRQKGKICPKKIMSLQACSKCLRKIMNEVGIAQQYGLATIRHAVMIKFKKYGATQEDVNAFKRYAQGSNVVDVYYNKPVERDLSTLLLSGGDF